MTTNQQPSAPSPASSDQLLGVTVKGRKPHLWLDDHGAWWINSDAGFSLSKAGQWIEANFTGNRPTHEFTHYSSEAAIAFILAHRDPPAAPATPAPKLATCGHVAYRHYDYLCIQEGCPHAAYATLNGPDLPATPAPGLPLPNEEAKEQLQTVHAHVKEALELLGVDVSPDGYIPDSWTLREQCRLAKQKIDNLTEAKERAERERDEAVKENRRLTSHLAATVRAIKGDGAKVQGDLGESVRLAVQGCVKELTALRAQRVEVSRESIVANLNYLCDACDTAARRFELLHAGGVKMTNGVLPATGQYEIRRAAEVVREWWAKATDRLPDSPAVSQPEARLRFPPAGTEVPRLKPLPYPDEPEGNGLEMAKLALEINSSGYATPGEHKLADFLIKVCNHLAALEGVSDNEKPIRS